MMSTVRRIFLIAGNEKLASSLREAFIGRGCEVQTQTIDQPRRMPSRLEQEPWSTLGEGMPVARAHKHAGSADLVVLASTPDPIGRAWVDAIVRALAPDERTLLARYRCVFPNSLDPKDLEHAPDRLTRVAGPAICRVHVEHAFDRALAAVGREDSLMLGLNYPSALIARAEVGKYPYEIKLSVPSGEANMPPWHAHAYLNEEVAQQLLRQPESVCQVADGAIESDASRTRRIRRVAATPPTYYDALYVAVQLSGGDLSRADDLLLSAYYAGFITWPRTVARGYSPKSDELLRDIARRLRVPMARAPWEVSIDPGVAQEAIRPTASGIKALQDGVGSPESRVCAQILALSMRCAVGSMAEIVDLSEAGIHGVSISRPYRGVIEAIDEALHSPRGAIERMAEEMLYADAFRRHELSGPHRFVTDVADAVAAVGALDDDEIKSAATDMLRRTPRAWSDSYARLERTNVLAATERWTSPEEGLLRLMVGLPDSFQHRLLKTPPVQALLSYGGTHTGRRSAERG